MAGKIDVPNLRCVGVKCDDFRTSLQESIKNIIKEESYLKYKVEIKSVPQAGNFLSVLYEVDITGETATGSKITSLFIKKSVTFDKITFANISDAFSRELSFYNDISNIFLRLQETAKVPEKERYRFVKIYTSTDIEAIIMENLSKKGFKPYNGKEVVSLKFAELSITELAKFHALSYVLKKRIPKYFDNKIKTIKHPFHLDNDWEGFINNICTITAQVFKGEAADKSKISAPRMLQIYQKYQKGQPSNGCLCHGDYKILNILARDVDGELVEVHPIDYQLVYYGNPVDDFLFFVFTGTDRKFRKKHLSYLKDLYFDNFLKFLSYFDMNVNLTYSRQEFDADYEERLGLGLVFGLYVSVFTFADIENGFDVSKLSLSELPIVPNEMFTARVTGIVQDYIDWGYL